MLIDPKLLGFAWDAWRAGRCGPAGIVVRQRARLADLIRFARARSPLYHKLYRHLPADIDDVRQLPPMTKPRLMAHFDAGVTDPAVTRAGVEAFLADKTLVGRPYLGRYLQVVSKPLTAGDGDHADIEDLVSVVASSRGFETTC